MPIIGYDANAPYLSTMLSEMPCGKGRIGYFQYLAGAAPMLTERLNAETWLGFAEVDIEIPDPLWLKFKDLPIFFFPKQTRDEAVPQPMKDYLQRTGGKRGEEEAGGAVVSAKAVAVFFQCYIGM